MTYTIETHKRLQFLRDRIASVKQEWAELMPSKVANWVCAEGKYTFSAPQDVTELSKQFEDECKSITGGRCAYQAIIGYLDDLADSVKAIRRERKPSNAYAPLKKAERKSQREAEGIITNGFQRSNIKLAVGSDVGVEVEGESKYTRRNYVTVAVSWWRSIGERGFGLVNMPSGLMFVTKCSHRAVPYVDEDGMNAWEVEGLTFKHGKGSVVTGWLVTHTSTDHSGDNPLVDPHSRQTQIPHAFGKNLSKAHSLMKQRTVRHLTKQLEV